MTRKILIIVISICICFFVAYLSSLLQMESLHTWYPTLNKPSLTPPNIVFPIVWSTLYMLMGISIGLVVDSPKSEMRKVLIVAFILQLILNFLWSISFFYCESPRLGFMNIILLDITVIWYTIKAFGYKKSSSILFIPYVLWLIFATYLTTFVFLYNS